jgi:hypothetical protein
MTKLCRQQAEVILNHDSENVILHNAKPDIKNIRVIKLAAVRYATVQVTRLLL